MADITKLQKYLKADGCKDGDIVTFLTAGEIMEKTFTQDGEKEIKEVYEVSVSINGSVKLYNPNGTTIKLLSKAWGTDTEQWKNKKARVTLIPAPNGKEMILLKPIEATLREAAQARNEPVSGEDVPF